jgi:flavin reductase (DIM6/NTAB) family NADH-FMN oxidoreductase RutF
MSSPDVSSPAAVDPAVMRSVMARFATGVAIVSTIEGDVPYAAAVNSLTSVSLDPPVILVCFKRESRTCEALIRRGAFGVSVLAEEHESHSRRFARSQPAHDDPALVLVDGLPVIRGAVAGLLCETDSVVEKGDHVVVFGRVARTHQSEGLPLLFFASGYHRLDRLEPRLRDAGVTLDAGEWGM